MKFIITKASDYWNEHEEEKTFNSLEELIQFQKDCGKQLIIRDGHITIYDDYIE